MDKGRDEGGFDNGRDHPGKAIDSAAGEQRMKVTYPDDNPKTIHGLAKPSTWGIPTTFLFKVGAVMALGVKKYGLFNWRRQRVTASTYYDAIERHLQLWRDGQNYDIESGQHHLAHVAACAGIIMDAEQTDMLNDDRGTPGTLHTMLASMTKPVKTDG